MTEQFRKYVLFEDIPAAEIRLWEQSFTYLLKKISLANHEKQLVLKSPPHTARMKQLLTLFPEAKFIFIHRNPYHVYASNKKFWGVLQKAYALQGAESIDVNAVILDTYARMMQRYLQEKELIPGDQLTEIAYDDFIQNPVESLRKAYNALRLPDFSYCEENMALFTGPQRHFVQLKHDLPETERKMVSEQLEPYIRHWNYELL
jgi:hypothetical protein